MRARTGRPASPATAKARSAARPECESDLNGGQGWREWPPEEAAKSVQTYCGLEIDIMAIMPERQLSPTRRGAPLRRKRPCRRNVIRRRHFRVPIAAPTEARFSNRGEEAFSKRPPVQCPLDLNQYPAAAAGIACRIMQQRSSVSGRSGRRLSDCDNRCRNTQHRIRASATQRRRKMKTEDALRKTPVEPLAVLPVSQLAGIPAAALVGRRPERLKAAKAVVVYPDIPQRLRDADSFAGQRSCRCSG